ncbi:hypothetical protein [Caudoviricetes sp.]|nr:hypothetical protein [Caudoviricetes sp.]
MWWIFVGLFTSAAAGTGVKEAAKNGLFRRK